MKTILALTAAFLFSLAAPVYAAKPEPVNEKNRHSMMTKKKKQKKNKKKGLFKRDRARKGQSCAGMVN
jgi:hypothetical protein